MAEPAAAPTPSPPALARTERALVIANQWAVVSMMATMAVLVFVNVVTRYAFNHSIIWVEELTQYLMIWITYLGAGLAFRQGRHVAVEMGQDALPSGARRALRAAIGVLVLAFLVSLVVLGLRYSAFAWDQESPVMQIPLGVAYLAIPLGAALFAIHLVLMFRGYVDKRFEESPDLELPAEPGR